MLAVVFGVGECPLHRGLEALPQCTNSATTFADYLVGNVFNLPRQNLLRFIDRKASSAAQLEHLGHWLARRQSEMKQAGRPATDFIFFYSGHGAFTRGDKAYYLATRRTVEGIEGATSIRFVDLISLLKAYANSLRHYLILDCCFAASAVRAQSPEAAVRRIVKTQQDQLPTRGTAMLCSSSADDVSVAPRGQDLTMFSGALLDVLRVGVPAEKSRLTLSDIGRSVERLLKDRHEEGAVRPELHVPEQTKGNIAENVPLFPNLVIAPSIIRFRKESVSAVEEILEFNSGRDDERLTKKYRFMRSNPYRFFRATSHLFYVRGMPQGDLTDNAPLAWISGDLHVEGFGVYRGDNAEVLFDVMDFDETALAPNTWELLRMMTSIYVAAAVMGIKIDADAMCHAFVAAYSSAMGSQKPRYVTANTASAKIPLEMLKSVRERSRKALLARYAAEVGGSLSLSLPKGRLLPASEEQKESVIHLVKKSADQHPRLKSLRILDVARRVAGTGSLGVHHYLLLAEAQKSKLGKQGPILLDLKAALPSSLQALTKQQRIWQCEAERVVEVQKRSQAIPPAFLTAIFGQKVDFILRELQPWTDRVRLDLIFDSFQAKHLVAMAATMGNVLAWNHMRCAAWMGSAALVELSEFNSVADDLMPLVEVAKHNLALQVLEDYRQYVEAFDAGVFSTR